MFRLFSREKSGLTAKKRLKAVVSRDRANVSAEFIIALTADIISAAVKYIVPDYDNISIAIERREGGTVLAAHLPIVSYAEVLPTI